MSRTALYRFYDSSGDLLYVGISLAPWARWKQHKGEKDWAEEVATSTMEWFDTRPAALAAEKAAIIAEEPRHNVVHNGGKRNDPDDVVRVEWSGITDYYWTYHRDGTTREVFFKDLLPPALVEAFTAERVATLAQHHSTTTTAGPRWEFEAKRSGYERTTDLYLQPEPNGLAVLCDYYDDELNEHEVIEVYVEWLERHHKGSLDAIPIFWTVMGSDVCEVAPHAKHGFLDGSNFLTHFTHPVDVDTGERCSFYRLPIRHRFPSFWKALGYEPAPLQSDLPLASILGLSA